MVTTAVAVAALATLGSVLAARAARPGGEVLPEPTAFRAGTCRTIAEPLLAVARLEPALAGAREVPAADLGRVAAAQKRLLAAHPRAEADVAVPLRDLVTALGYVRLRSDSRSYDPAVWREADLRRRAVQGLCTVTR